MMDRSLEGRATPAGYRMIESLTVRNFRCFQTLRLEGLRRINLIVGRNGAGKTALLEAIRMCIGGTPAIASWMNQVRGGGAIIFQQTATREQFESLWNHLFFKFENERRIVFDRQDSDGLTTSLQIFFDQSQAVTQIPQTPPASGAEAAALQRMIPPSAIWPLVFRRNSQSVHGDLKATVLPNGGLQLEPGQELGPASAVLGALVGYQAQDQTNWFSEFIKRNREAEILEIVQREYPEVRGFAIVQNPFGGSVWVSVPYLRDKEPLSLLSGGINKFFTLVLAVHFYRHGVVLVDEIENGTYYDRLPSLWTALHRISGENDCQIFATTHSQECLDAALDIIKQDDKNFSLIRLSRTDGETTAEQFVGLDVASAIEEGIEVR